MCVFLNIILLSFSFFFSFFKGGGRGELGRGWGGGGVRGGSGGESVNQVLTLRLSCQNARVQPPSFLFYSSVYCNPMAHQSTLEGLHS